MKYMLRKFRVKSISIIIFTQLKRKTDKPFKTIERSYNNDASVQVKLDHKRQEKR